MKMRPETRVKIEEICRRPLYAARCLGVMELVAGALDVDPCQSCNQSVLPVFDARLRAMAEILARYVGDDGCKYGDADDPDPECGCRWCRGRTLLDEERRRVAAGGVPK